MTDKTRWLLDIHEESVVKWISLFRKYTLYDEQRGVFILEKGGQCGIVRKNSMGTNAIVLVWPYEIDQMNSEVIEIRKRLEFLNKL